ncbi:MAG TPA: c-type cytochrome [Vicinamibacterales bacterium]
MNTRVLTLAGGLALAAMLAATAGVRAQQEDRSKIEDWKPEQLHNIQVLPKDITPDQLMAVMRGWNAALNVDCVFCHKGQVGQPWSTYDFTDDSKVRHEVARLMVRATTSLNEQFKELGDPDQPMKVTCATCHRRNRHPETDLPPADAK